VWQVDENWNVKVSDFGFARIKDENQTMTPQTGSPCWTSPEVLLGKRYDEKADVYSFGVVMWEVVTRRQPFCGRHFLDVSLDVIAGKRPTIPAECPGELRDTIKQCWQTEAADRPCMEEVLARLDTMLARGPFPARPAGREFTLLS
jgi:serine/threonine protein kinase